MSRLKMMRELIRYQYRQYILSSKWVLPMIALICILPVLYSMKPVAVVSSLSISGLLLFMGMVWVGVTNQEIESEVSEQLMILRIQSERKYYVSHILFLTVLSNIGALISLMVPVLKNILEMNTLFDRRLIWSDIVGGYLLLFAFAFTGAMTGELFHIRLVKERKIGLSATFFVALLAVIRNGVIQKYPISKFLLWVVPPVSDVVSWFSDAQYFDVVKVADAFGLLLVYGMILAVVKMELLRIKKF